MNRTGMRRFNYYTPLKRTELRQMIANALYKSEGEMYKHEKPYLPIMVMDAYKIIKLFDEIAFSWYISKYYPGKYRPYIER